MRKLNLEHIFSELFTVGKPNAIESYLIDELTDSYSEFDSVKNLIRHLEMASCASGSWSGLIYTRDIQDKLDRQDWRDSIDDALDQYQDATGETYTLESHYAMESLVTFAVDWFANDIASRLQSLVDWEGGAWIVTIAEDSCDPWPDHYAVIGEANAIQLAQDLVNEKLQLVGPEQDIQEIEESLWQLVKVESE